jgi:hypothetical protein
MKRLAEQAELQADAPVSARVTREIHAPASLLWDRFSRVQDWPRWNADARGASIDGPFAAGTAFGYGTRSRHQLWLARVEPPRLVAFYGTLAGYKGVTLWQFDALSPDRTRVTVRESSDGPFISVFYSSARLEQHLKLWVDALQAEAERGAADARQPPR